MIQIDPDFLWVHLLVCGISVIIGFHLVFNPPKDMSTATGLNLPISKAKLNIDTWTELHVYSGKVLVICGSVCFLLSLFLNYLIGFAELPSSKIEGLNLVLLIITSKVIAITTFVVTENHMNKTFDKSGNRKDTII